MPILTSNEDDFKDTTAIKLLQGCNLLEHFYEIIKSSTSISDYELQHTL